MPELPEVETICRQLRPWLTGRRILKARRAQAPPGPKYQDLEQADGQIIHAVLRRGKYIILPLSKGDEILIHLGMTGVISPTAPPGHLRVRLDMDGSQDSATLYFRDVRRFGRFRVLLGGDRSALPTLATLGPEPLSEAFTGTVLHTNCRSRVAIKTHLLSQRPVAGLGNIYVDEALWQARIHPRMPAFKITRPKAARLRDAIVAILEAAVQAGGTTLNDYRTVDGREGDYGRGLRAYGRGGQPCHRCETPMKRVLLGQRSTHFCPRCQRR